MAIKNYTSEQTPEKSIQLIQDRLRTKGAKSISMQYGNKGEVTAIVFTMEVRKGIVMAFELPAKVDACYKAMVAARSRTFKEASLRKQAERTAWRIVFDWVDVQLALVELGQAEAGQVFMPYALDENGTTAWDSYMSVRQKQLTAGGKG
jgi:hypothetical protein